MQALVFQYKFSKLAIARILGTFSKRGYLTRMGPLKLKEIPFPQIRNADWIIAKTKYCGICGSDHKQVFLDGNRDNPITALISWPQVLGHEAVGVVVRKGAQASLQEGDRVALNPWLSCGPRGIVEWCEACQDGQYSLCRNFTKGSLAPGIHTGNSKDATGGFAEYFPAHKDMAIKIPDHVSDKQAIFSDPFSVVFHSILKAIPAEGSTCGVYGCGNLGLLTILTLKKIFKGIRVVAVARFSHQEEMAKRFGADMVVKSQPSEKVVESIGDYLNVDVYHINNKRAWLIEGLDSLFDTVASKETLELGIRIVKARPKNPNNSGKIIVTGVSKPKRYEWTPWYFKEISIIGSNAFALETFQTVKQHSYMHYFKFLEEERIDPSPMLTHLFPLNKYRKAFLTARKQDQFKSIKVAFQYD
jgi:threonine dehydrogenase-like Zn-dependent dehydrogenase